MQLSSAVRQQFLKLKVRQTVLVWSANQATNTEEVLTAQLVQKWGEKYFMKVQ